MELFSYSDLMHFFISFSFCFLLISCGDSNERKSELPRNDIKRSRRIPENTEAILAGGMLSMNLSSSSSPVYTEPLLAFSNAQIPFLSERERAAMFDEAVFNQNFGLIKLFKQHGIISGMVDSDHLESLFRNDTELSTEILEYLMDHSQTALAAIQGNLPEWLISCVPRGLSKFKLLWTRFNASELDIITLSGIISKIAANYSEEFYDFVFHGLGSDGGAEKRDSVMKKGLVTSILYYRLGAVRFLLDYGSLSVSLLDSKLKIKALLMAVNANDLFITRALLSDAELQSLVWVMPKSPWLVAIKKDYPGILDLFISSLPQKQFNEIGLAMYALSQLSLNVLRYFKVKGVLTETLVVAMAQTAIEGNRLEAFDMLVKLDLDVYTATSTDNLNLLTLAARNNSLAIVEYLLKVCGFDPNTPNQQYNGSNCRTTSTAIHSAKTAEMVQLLCENGADPNVLYVKENHFGSIVKSSTALHQAAASENIPVFLELIKRGANILIPDDTGKTNEEFLSQVEALERKN